MDIHELVIVIPVPFVESVNKLHSACIRKKVTYSKKTKRKITRSYADIILSDAARKAKERYLKALNTYAPKDQLPRVDWKNVDITYGYYISSKTFSRRDYDNMTKIFQDCLAYHMGFNDACIVNGHSYKRCIPIKSRTTKNEYIYVKIKNRCRTDDELKTKESEIKSLVGLSWN